jgi:phosphoribosylanthranilate isomerase
MTWVKICGITNLEDALTAVEAGADALGFVFYEKSPRKVDVETAREIVAKVPEKVEKVGVFVEQFEDSICRIVDTSGLTVVQLQGDDQDPHVADLVVERRPELRVLVGISMLHHSPEGRAMMWRPDLGFSFLLDSGGGTGKVFDWEKGRATTEVIRQLGPIIVAGGLNAANVAEAMRVFHPWGVDVASGVEARPGKKDPEKLKAFIAAVREADRIRVGK